MQDVTLIRGYKRQLGDDPPVGDTFSANGFEFEVIGKNPGEDLLMACATMPDDLTDKTRAELHRIKREARERMQQAQNEIWRRHTEQKDAEE